MYCPQCGQQQVTEETRFCARCGFPLVGVMDLLAHGGILPVREESSPDKTSPRRKGIHQGLLMMFIGVLLTPVLAILSDLFVPDILVPLSAIIFFWGGILRILYALIIEKSAAPSKQEAVPAYVPPSMPAQLGPTARPSALPPQRSTPVTGWRQRTDTSELVPPPSVTENTTRLLDKEPESPKRSD